ncbi:replication initiation protein [Magnetospirillum sulfuroxidans]|uniref:Replication initiation protein n=1 Tax=Magnetospirillum sulfuroxidans TaxID=611300 RepID=A0ABS5IH96_9PROT|nr:replication initiation protein [Magnetospirillum sulfuroxidans]MBR9973796.1 replication initiation protein [Magnetospirillum sulfuroxidans]
MASSKRKLRSTTSIEPWSDDHMVKPAELIDVRLPSSLTLVDRRTFNALLRNAWDRIDQNGAEHVIALSELKGLHTGSNQRIAETIKRLMTALIEAEVKGRKGNIVVRRAQMLGGNDMDDDDNRTGILTYTFDPRLISIIRSSTTWGQLRIKVMAAFSSKYALSLYEMGERRIHMRKFEEELSLSELRNRLGVDGLHRYADLNRWAIKPAIEEVNAFALGFNMAIQELKRGKSVVGVRLRWWPKDEEQRQEAASEINRCRLGRQARVKKTVEALAQRQMQLRLDMEAGLRAAAPNPADYLGDEIPDF